MEKRYNAEKTNFPLVSIALCVYNGEKYLKEQLNSIVNQTYKNIEIIVCDDCSTDSSVAILNSYLEQKLISKVFINESNIGFEKNFSQCITKCSGYYISCCDQDDIWLDYKIETLVNEICDYQLIYSDSEFIDASGKKINQRISDYRNFFSGSDGRSLYLINCISGHSLMFRASLLQYIFPIPQDIFHDWWIAYVATTIGSITFTPQVLTLYRQHGSTATDFLKINNTRQSIIEKKRQQKSKVEKSAENLNWISIFKNFGFNKPLEQGFYNGLHKAYTFKDKYHVRVVVLFYLLRHFKVLTFMRKKSFLSNLVLIYKQSR